MKVLLTKIGPVGYSGWIEGGWILCKDGHVISSGNIDRDIIETPFGPWIRINDLDGLILDPSFNKSRIYASAYEKDFFFRFFHTETESESPSRVTVHRALAVWELKKPIPSFYVEQARSFQDGQIITNRFLVRPETLKRYFSTSMLKPYEIHDSARALFASFVLEEWDKLFDFGIEVGVDKAGIELKLNILIRLSNERKRHRLVVTSV